MPRASYLGPSDPSLAAPMVHLSLFPGMLHLRGFPCKALPEYSGTCCLAVLCVSLGLRKERWRGQVPSLICVYTFRAHRTGPQEALPGQGLSATSGHVLGEQSHISFILDCQRAVERERTARESPQAWWQYLVSSVGPILDLVRPPSPCNEIFWAKKNLWPSVQW